MVRLRVNDKEGLRMRNDREDDKDEEPKKEPLPFLGRFPKERMNL
jgi:hypothetical protein